jgi:hypothetical protein
MKPEKWHNRIEDQEREQLKQKIADILMFYDKLTGVNVSYMTVADNIMKEIEKQ